MFQFAANTRKRSYIFCEQQKSRCLKATREPGHDGCVSLQLSFKLNLFFSQNGMIAESTVCLKRTVLSVVCIKSFFFCSLQPKWQRLFYFFQRRFIPFFLLDFFSIFFSPYIFYFYTSFFSFPRQFRLGIKQTRKFIQPRRFQKYSFIILLILCF